eukprot:c23235_g3_i1 orf=2-232(+)
MMMMKKKEKDLSVGLERGVSELALPAEKTTPLELTTKLPQATELQITASQLWKGHHGVKIYLPMLRKRGTQGAENM